MVKTSMIVRLAIWMSLIFIEILGILSLVFSIITFNVLLYGFMIQFIALFSFLNIFLFFMFFFIPNVKEFADFWRKYNKPILILLFFIMVYIIFLTIISTLPFTLILLFISVFLSSILILCVEGTYTHDISEEKEVRGLFITFILISNLVHLGLVLGSSYVFQSGIDLGLFIFLPSGIALIIIGILFVLYFLILYWDPIVRRTRDYNDEHYKFTSGLSLGIFGILIIFTTFLPYPIKLITFILSVIFYFTALLCIPFGYNLILMFPGAYIIAGSISPVPLLFALLPLFSAFRFFILIPTLFSIVACPIFTILGIENLWRKYHKKNRR